jgi:nucleoside-diphosphate-sugar epimerase
MSSYLVSGGAGFIGSNIVETLVKKGEKVRVIDNLSSGKEENLKAVLERIEFLKDDIRSAQACLSATKDIDFVLHQAALRSVPKSLASPGEYNEVNIQGTLNMLEAGLKNKVKTFVFASSSSIYGEAEKFPQKETHQPRLISPYALTKLAGEYYCRIFAKNYKFNTVSLRYFNVYGPRQALDDEYAVVIPKFITCILEDQPPPIYGNGKQSRDFTFIDDVVEANLLAANKRHAEHEVFNVAGGRDYSILELVDLLNEIIKKNIKPTFLPLRPGDAFKTQADLTLIKKKLGYKPKVNFENGLKKAVDYFKKL